MKRVYLGSALALCLLGLTASTALADVSVTAVGVNTHFPSTGGTGSIAGQQPGTATLEKVFTSLGDVPIILHSTPSAGVDSLLIQERITNNTGVTWTDFHFLMQRIDANPALAVDFQNVINPTGEWGSIVPGPNSLTLANGIVPSGSTFSVSFNLQVTSQQGSFDEFGIHEVPSVPEPCTLALLGCSLLGVMRRRGRGLPV